MLVARIAAAFFQKLGSQELPVALAVSQACPLKGDRFLTLFNFLSQGFSLQDRPSSRQRQSQQCIPVLVLGSRQRKHLPLGEAPDTGEERRDRSGTSARPSTTVSRERNQTGAVRHSVRCERASLTG